MNAFLKFTVSATVFAAAAGPVAAQGQALETIETSAGEVRAEAVAEGLNHPWAIDFLPDGNMLVTERAGTMRIITREGEMGPSVEGVPEVVAQRQGGLLDVHVDSRFAENGMIYFSYSEPAPRGVEGVEGSGAGTAVMAARLVHEGVTGRLSEQEVIFRMNRYTRSGVHFGSRIVEAEDGTLWITLGERGERARAQDPFDLAGAVVRINKDGTIPEDNPFADGQRAHPAIWSIGHRNPQGAALGPDGALWTLAHGAAGGDEINRPQAGENYGWPEASFGTEYSGAPFPQPGDAPGFEAPLHYWDPSIAPSGLAFYEGGMFPEWQGDLLVGALKFQLLSRLNVENGAIVDEEQMFEGAFGRIREVEVGPDGAIYLATDENNGRIIRITKSAQ